MLSTGMEIEFRICYYVYILTDRQRESLKVGVTVDLKALLNPAPDEVLFRPGDEQRCLLYYEKFDEVRAAVAREGELSAFSKRRLRRLVALNNPEWLFLDEFDP